MPHRGISQPSGRVVVSCCKSTHGYAKTLDISIFINTLRYPSPQDHNLSSLDILAAVRYTQMEVPHSGRQMLGAPPNMGVGP